MVTQRIAKNRLSAISQSRKYNFINWMQRRFEFLKFASSTEKNDVAKDFLYDLLDRCGYKNIKTFSNRQGDYDVYLKKSGKNIFFRCKMATLDTKKKLQFNSIRLISKKYTHLFCVGVFPDSTKFLIIKKRALNKLPHKMVLMDKNIQDSYKLTKIESDLLSFDQFQQEIANL